MSSLRYLITGGVGFLGINLSRFLLSRGYRVRILDIAPFDYAEQGQVEAILGDIRDSAAVDRAMRDYHTCDSQFVYLLNGWVELEFEGGEFLR